MSNFSTPALIIQGADDKDVKTENTKIAFSKLPQDDHHKLIIVERADHEFNGPELEQFIENSINFIKKYI